VTKSTLASADRTNPGLTASPLDAKADLSFGTTAGYSSHLAIHLAIHGALPSWRCTRGLPCSRAYEITSL
jgi:hypothetical protein